VVEPQEGTERPAARRPADTAPVPDALPDALPHATRRGAGGRGGVLVVYSRARCGVCRTAEARLRRELRTVMPWRRPTVHVVDVDTGAGATAGLTPGPVDPAVLVARYGVRVPVLVLDGVEISELELAPGTLRRALREHRRGA